MTNRVTFIIPGLLDPVPYLDQLPTQELPELSLFSTMLSRGNLFIPELLDYSANNFYSCLLKQFHLYNDLVVNRNDSKSLPVAGITYCYDVNSLPEPERARHNAAIKNKWVMRVDPCIMIPDRDQLVLSRIHNLDLSLDEAQHLVDEINDFFQADEEENFWTMHALTAERWYLVSDKTIEIETVPPDKVLGQSVNSFLFNNSRWLALFNEFQMILHSSTVNKLRLQQGKLPVNSLWFWGTGKAIDFSMFTPDNPAIVEPPVIYTDNPFVQSLAGLKNYPSFNLTDEYKPLQTRAEQQVIYVINDFIEAIQNKDIFSWVGSLKQFDSRYLSPLSRDIKSGKISQIEFISPTGRKLLLTKKLMKRWWRRTIPFYKFLSQEKA